MGRIADIDFCISTSCLYIYADDDAEAVFMERMSLSCSRVMEMMVK